MTSQTPRRAMGLCHFLNIHYSRLWLQMGGDYTATAAAAIILQVVPCLVGLIVCRRIFASIAAGGGFQPSLARGLRMLAWVLWTTIPAEYLFAPSLFNRLREFSYVLLSRAFGLGLAIYFMAILMDEAARLQAEQDLVV